MRTFEFRYFSNYVFRIEGEKNL